MLSAFQKHIDTNFSFLKDKKLLLAISGGLDSVALTHIFLELKLDISLAHCNFNLRSEESDEDEKFVINLSKDLDLEVFIQNFETEEYAKENQLSIQMAARELRYKWFKDLADQLNFDFIITAHHADDNLETFLINLTRGTGLIGLSGIPEVNDKVIRPLLPFSREEIENYAIKRQLKWREDSSNNSTKYLRNALRLEVIPMLKKLNPQLIQNFKSTQFNLQEASDIINDATLKIHKKIVSVEGEIIKFKIKKLKKLQHPKAYLYQLLKGYNFTEWDDIINLLDAQSGKQVMSKTHRLIKDRKYLLLTEVKDDSKDVFDRQPIHVSDIQKEVKTSLGILFFDEADAIFGKRTNLIFLDADKLKFPLVVRSWKKGDFFYPSGMTGKKKLSKYFKDEKLSLIDKEKTLVLCSGNDIVWVINRRVDARFNAADDTKSIVKVELK